jgi:hypothetical protein
MDTILGSDIKCGRHRQPGWLDDAIRAPRLGHCGFAMFEKKTMANHGDSIWDLWIDLGGES